MLHTGTNQTELFFDLVREGEKCAKISLTEMQESYIVFMLQRYLRKTEITTTVLALEYLENLAKNLHERQYHLSETADSGLILAGLFPERSRRLNLSYAYFTEISQLCFFDLAVVCERLKHKGEALLYRELGENINELANVLQALRCTKDSHQLLSFETVTSFH